MSPRAHSKIRNSWKGKKKKSLKTSRFVIYLDIQTHPENSGGNFSPWLICNFPLFSLAMRTWDQLEVSDLGFQGSVSRELHCRVCGHSPPVPVFPLLPPFLRNG